MSEFLSVNTAMINTEIKKSPQLIQHNIKSSSELIENKTPN